MKKYIIILSLFLCACTKYRVYNLESKTIHIIYKSSGYEKGDTIFYNFKYINPHGEGIIYNTEKCLILNSITMCKNKFK